MNAYICQTNGKRTQKTYRKIKTLFHDAGCSSNIDEWNRLKCSVGVMLKTDILNI